MRGRSNRKSRPWRFESARPGASVSSWLPSAAGTSFPAQRVHFPIETGHDDLQESVSIQIAKRGCANGARPELQTPFTLAGGAIEGVDLAVAAHRQDDLVLSIAVHIGNGGGTAHVALTLEFVFPGDFARRRSDGKDAAHGRVAQTVVAGAVRRPNAVPRHHKRA